MDGELLSATFVELTDTMVAGFDVIDFLQVLADRSVELLDVSAAGLLLADPRGELREQVIGALNLFRPAREPWPRPTSGSVRRWPTWPPSACCMRAGQGQARRASRGGHGPGIYPAARPRQDQQPPSV